MSSSDTRTQDVKDDSEKVACELFLDELRNKSEHDLSQESLAMQTLDSKQTKIRKAVKEGLAIFNIKEYVLKKIGRGSFAVVYAVQMPNKVKFAVKCMRHTSRVEEELRLWKKMKCKHIISMKRHLCVRDYDLFFMEKGETCLKDYMLSNYVSEETIMKTVEQIVAAVKYMHEMSIAHRDLKLTNVMICYGNVVKVIDFTLSKEVPEGGREYGRVGTAPYMAPEMRNVTSYCPFKADIWSLGVLCYTLLHKTPPFDYQSDNLVKMQMLKRFLFNPFFSNYCKDFVSALLDPDPMVRPNAAEVADNQWFKTSDEDRKKAS